MTIAITFVGDRAVALKFEEFPVEARQRLYDRVVALTQELQGRIVAAEPFRTGKLRSETELSSVNAEDHVSATVRIAGEFGKAGALEYGAHGTAQVSAHQARLTHVFARATEMIVEVEAHARHVNIAEHRFLRGPLAGMEGEILTQLEDALDQAASE